MSAKTVSSSLYFVIMCQTLKLFLHFVCRNNITKSSFQRVVLCHYPLRAEVVITSMAFSSSIIVSPSSCYLQRPLFATLLSYHCAFLSCSTYNIPPPLTDSTAFIVTPPFQKSQWHTNK